MQGGGVVRYVYSLFVVQVFYRGSPKVCLDVSIEYDFFCIYIYLTIYLNFLHFIFSIHLKISFNGFKPIKVFFL